MTLRELIASISFDDYERPFDQNKKVFFATEPGEKLELLSVYLSDNKKHIRIDIG